MEFIFFQLLTGIAMGANLFLVAAGLSLIYGVLHVVNFSQATFYMLAAYICYSLTLLLGGGTGFWIGLVVAPLAVAVLGGLVEISMFRRIYKKLHYVQLLLAWGLILVLNDAFKFIWGPEKKMTASPSILNGGVQMPGDMIFPYVLIFAIVMAAAIGIMLYFLIYRSKWGKTIRAAASDAEIASSLGVDVDKLYTFVFAFACWLGGLGGVVATLTQPVFIGADMEVILAAFIIVIVGGMGSILGSLVGSLIVGVVSALGIMILPRFALVFLYVIMVLILIIRPHGLLGKEELH
ncbi:branched-chain amino acid ABC transporter permease [Chloroflexota bacterium]